MTKPRSKSLASRRRFLAGAAAGAGGAALAFPSLVGAQGPIVLRCQSAWGEKRLFHEFALDFAAKVNDMSGGDLKLEMRPVGAVVPASGLLEAVSKGQLDGAHGTMSHNYARHPALGLWSAGPAFGMDANMLLAWHKYGGGKQLLAKVYAAIAAQVVSFPYGPMPTQPLGWFKKRVTKPEDFKGLRYRTIGMAVELFSGMGAQVHPLPAEETAQALRSGALDAAEVNNAATDRSLGLAQSAGICMLRSYHQNAEQFEILLNKPKFEALPGKLRMIIENAVEAASQDMAWKAIDRYSKAYLDLRVQDKVSFHQTPDAVLRRELQAYDAAAAKRRQGEVFAEVEQSQKAFAERAVRWDLDTVADRRMAYDHYFAAPAPRPRSKKR